VFYVLSKLLDVFLSPLTWGLVLFAAAVPWRRRWARRWRRRRAFGAAGLVVLLLTSTSTVSSALLWSLEHAPIAPAYRDDVTYDAVVLLGGIVDEAVTQESGQPSYNDNVERVVMTHRLLRDGKARYAIISGGTVEARYAAHGEAVQLAKQLEDWGIARDRLIIEDRSMNTRENALFSQRIAAERGFRRVAIVTSAFHMPRAMDCFRAVGMEVDGYRVDFRARAGTAIEPLPRAIHLAISTAMIREIFGRVIYRAQGYGKGPSARP